MEGGSWLFLPGQIFNSLESSVRGYVKIVSSKNVCTCVVCLCVCMCARVKAVLLPDGERRQRPAAQVLAVRWLWKSTALWEEAGES